MQPDHACDQMQEQQERREAPRRAIQRKVWIKAHRPLECEALDISATGIRLRGYFGDVPDCFVLLLTRQGEVTRHCEIVWRAADQVGIRFL
jgi:hypothetical protein